MIQTAETLQTLPSFINFLIANFMLCGVFLISGGLIIGQWYERYCIGETINVNTAVSLINQKKAVLIDIRHKDDHEQHGHILNAIDSNAESVINNAADYVKHECVIIMDGGDGIMLPKVAKSLRKVKVARVAVLEGGFKAWQNEGLPIQGVK